MRSAAATSRCITSLMECSALNRKCGSSRAASASKRACDSCECSSACCC
ncbi:hypothetical protein [Lysobacter gummosus]